MLLDVFPRITPNDNQTNLVYRFFVPEGTKALTICFSYAPQKVEELVAKRALQEALPKFFSPEKAKEIGVTPFMPLSNLLTISCSSEKKGYIGCHHTKDASQCIKIGEYSSAGFSSVSSVSGPFEVMIHVYAAISPKITAHLCVKTEKGA